MTWQLVLSGLLVGGLVGMTGMGGGSLMTPILVILLGFNPAIAVGTDIAHGAIFKTVGAARHRRLGNVQARLSGWMFLGSAPMSLLGVAVATWLKHRYGGGVASTMSYVLGGALLFGGLGLVAKSLVGARATIDGHFAPTRRDRLVAVAIGLFGGFVVGLTSVGSGTFFGLTMLLVFPLKAQKIVGTDIFHAAALLYVAGIGHLVAGNVDLPAVGWLLVGSIPGVLVGSNFSMRIPERVLQLALAFVLLLSAVKLLNVPGSTYLIAAALSAGAALLVAQRVRAATRRPGPVALSTRE